MYCVQRHHENTPFTQPNSQLGGYIYKVVEHYKGGSKRPLRCNALHVRQYHFPLNRVSELKPTHW
jgi:hypothetical protein